jgi:hypothetical protein
MFLLTELIRKYLIKIKTNNHPKDHIEPHSVISSLNRIVLNHNVIVIKTHRSQIELKRKHSINS